MTQFHCWPQIKPKSRIERLSECGLKCVDEGHCVRDAVEGQSSCTVIHIHSDFRRSGRHGELGFNVAVPEQVTGGRAEQTPGLIIKSKYKLTVPSLPANALIRHCYKNTFTPTPLNLPITTSTHILFTQHLQATIKSVWMCRIAMRCLRISSHTVVFK